MTTFRVRITAIWTMLVLAATLAVLEVPSDAAPGLTSVTRVSVGNVGPNGFDVHANATGKSAAVWVEPDTNGNGQVMLATRGPGGNAWSAPTMVAASGITDPSPTVVVGPGGIVTVLYTTSAGLRSRDQSVTGVLASALEVPDPGVVSFPTIGVAPDGTITAAWLSFDGATFPVMTAGRTAGSGWTTAVTLAPTSISVPLLTTGPDGQVAVSWLAAGRDALVRIRAAGSDQFAPTEEIGRGDYAFASIPRITFAANGVTRAVFVRDIGSGRRLVHSVRNNEAGTWSIPLSESAAESNSAVATVDPAGVLYVAWFEDVEGGRVVRTLRFDGSSSTVATIPGSLGVTSTEAPGITLGRSGAPVVSWGFTDGDGANFYAIRSNGSPTGTWGPALPTFTGTSPEAGQWVTVGDGELSLTAIHRPNPGEAFRVSSRILDSRGPVLALTAPSQNRRITGKSVLLRWTIKDLSGVGTSVLVRSAPYNGGFGSRSTWRTGVSTPFVEYGAGPGRTFCFVVRGNDVHSNVGGLSNERCAVTPVDDRTFAASSGWTKRTGAGFYRTTFRETTRNGAALSLRRVAGKSFALLVPTGPGFGKVSVFLGSTRLRTVSLASAVNRRAVIIPIKNFTSVRTGKLTVKVVTGGKRVRIDGVYVGR